MWSLLGEGEQKIAKGRGPLTKMAAMPIYDKKKIKDLLQNKISSGA